MVEIIKLDRADRIILDRLQRDGSQPIADIAAAAGMSTSPCWRRIKLLKERGVIKGETVLVDRERIGLGFVVYAFVKLDPPNKENMANFETLMADSPAVTLVEMITGNVDYLIRVVTEDMHAYDSFLRDTLLARGIISDVQSHIVLSTTKESTILPMPKVA